LKISVTHSSVLNRSRYGNGEPLLLLSDTLEIFRQRKFERQKLCLDIKDYGFEKTHLDLVKQHDLEKNIIFVSWIPQSLFKLQELGCRSPLVFSYWNIYRLGIFGRMISTIISRCATPVGHFVLLGRSRVFTDLGKLGHGYQHAVVAQELPEKMADVLSKSGGGICVHFSMVHQKMLAYCRDRKLQTWIFSVNGLKDYKRYAENDRIDVIFCDDAPTVHHHLINKGL
jgi:hypothetical protein